MIETIYFNNKRLVLTDKKKSIEKLPGSPYVVDTPDSQMIRELVDHLPHETVVLLHKNRDLLWELLNRHVTTVPAAGGLVTNANLDILLIFRRGKWDLPKGKLDEGEDLQACALREVEEETGLSGLDLKKPLAVTYHTYPEKGKLILKKSHWFLMHSSHNQKLVPQTDEDIEKCEWVAADRLAPYLDNTHPSIIDVLQAGMQRLGLQKNLT